MSRGQIAHWALHETGADFETIIVDWNDKLNDDERYFIKHILAFFAASDGYASLFFYTAIIALCSERHAVTFNGPARRVFFSLL